MDDEHYGALSIFPFIFSWLSLLVMPIMLWVKDKNSLKKINTVCYYIVYAPFSLCFLAVFCAVNLALLPLAYLKTVLHKILLLKYYKSRTYCKRLGTYVVLGVPFLLCAQVTDVYRFLAHSYDRK